jgi:hypothetical protein
MNTLSFASRVAVACLAIAAVTSLPSPGSGSAWAQASGMGGAGQSDTVVVRARVKAIDHKSRKITLVGPEGNTFSVIAGDEVRNFGQIKPGDTVVTRYHASVVYVLAPAGTPLPKDTLDVAGGRAAPGEMPAGAAGAKLVITGLVVGIDPAANTVSLVDRSGGAVRTIHVMDPERQKQLPNIKVGQTITAVVSEAIAIAVEPTR